MVKHMQAELCVEALENACRSNSVHGLILHSDRGSHFTCRLFRAALRRHEIRQSMSGTGCCYDNTRIESFFATLNKEKLYPVDAPSLSRSTVKSMVFRYIHY